MMKFSIRTKLFAASAVLALLGGAAGYGAVAFSLRNIAAQAIGEDAAQLAEVIMDDIDRLIYRRVEQVQIHAADLAKKEELLQSNRVFEAMQERDAFIAQKDEEWRSAPGEETTPFMVEILRSNLSQEMRDDLELTAFYQKTYGRKIFGEAFVTNKYGVNVAQTGKTTDYYQADEAWWQEAKEGGVYVSDVTFDESADVHALDIAVRVEDEAGQFLGVVKAVLNIEEVFEIIREIQADSAFSSIKDLKLLTKDRRVIFSTETGVAYMFLEDVSGKAFAQSLVGHTFDTPPSERFTVIEGDGLGDDEVLIAHAHSHGYRSFRGLGSSLLVTYATRDIFASVATANRSILLIVVALIILISALSFWIISRLVGRPSSRISGTA